MVEIIIFSKYMVLGLYKGGFVHAISMPCCVSRLREAKDLIQDPTELVGRQEEAGWMAKTVGSTPQPYLLHSRTFSQPTPNKRPRPCYQDRKSRLTSNGKSGFLMLLGCWGTTEGHDFQIIMETLPVATHRLKIHTILQAQPSSKREKFKVCDLSQWRHLCKGICFTS